jgi:RND family efflux transporter MFP subunit
MQRRFSAPRFSPHVLRSLLWAVVALGIATVGAALIIRTFRKPGQMTVLGGMNMDTVAMKATPGMVPVAVETVQIAPFEAKVTYTGSIVPYAEQSIAPRVDGYLRDFAVYAGDNVRAGQVLVRLEAPELGRKVSEAQYGSAAARGDVAVSLSEVARQQKERLVTVADDSRMEGERQAAEAERAAAQNELAATKSQWRAAGQAVTEARSMLKVKQAGVAAANQQIATAVASQRQADRSVASARATVTFRHLELQRANALVAKGFSSASEAQSQRAQHDAAVAAYEEMQAKVDEMKAAVETARANAEQAAAEVTAAQSRIEQAAAAADAAEAEIANRDAMARAAARIAEAAGAAVDSARRKVEATQAMIDKSRREVGQRESMAGRSQAELVTAQTVEDFRTVLAPFSGRVTRRLVSPGTLVGPTTPILTVAQLDRVRLQANVAEADLASIRVGAPVRATVRGREPVSGKVTAVFPQADQTSRTAVVEAVVPNADLRLIPGQYVVMEISTSTNRPRISVPTRAVVRREGASYAWIAIPAKDGMLTSSLRAVTLGPSDGQRTTVLSGLEPGQQVIYAGQEGLQEGAMVTPTPWTEEGPKELPPPMTTQPMPGTLGMPGMSGMEQGGRATPQAGEHPKPARPGTSSMPGMDMGGAPSPSPPSRPATPGSAGPPSGRPAVPASPHAGHEGMQGMGGM